LLYTTGELDVTENFERLEKGHAILKADKCTNPTRFEAISQEL